MLTSTAFKGEKDPTGANATWVIGAPAARAVEVLEHLQPPEVDTLFRSLHHARRATRLDALNTARTNQLLNRFILWVKTYCHAPAARTASRRPTAAPGS